MVDLDRHLVDAMNSELEAKKFYDDASKKAHSKAGKILFKELAEFEQNHYERVKKVIESLQRDQVLASPISVQDVPTINPEIKGEIEPNKDEIISVIKLAIDSEKRAQQKYKKIAELFDDERSKKIFIRLSQEESNHQRILEQEFYHLSNKGVIIWE